MDEQMFGQEVTADIASERKYLAQKIQSHKDSIGTLQTRLDALKPGRIQERLERATGRDRRLFGAEAEASRLANLIDEHESHIRIYERKYGHSLSKWDGEIWYTNPYGVDGYLGTEANLETINEILADMAHGRIYGLVPE